MNAWGATVPAVRGWDEMATKRSCSVVSSVDSACVGEGETGAGADPPASVRASGVGPGGGSGTGAAPSGGTYDWISARNGLEKYSAWSTELA